MLNLAYVVGTFFQIGYLPGMPGTWGSIAAFILSLYLKDYNLLGLTIVTGVMGLWASQKVATHEKIPDPSHVVIDEVFGFLLLVILAENLTPYLSPSDLFILLILFRVFDIWKPWPIDVCENFFEKRSSLWGLGIMLDDVMATFFALGSWYALFYL